MYGGFVNIKSTIDFFFRSRVSKVDSLADGVTEFNVVVMSSIVIVDICSVCCVSAIVVITLSVGVFSDNVDVTIELSIVDDGVCVISVTVVCVELVASGVLVCCAVVDVPSRVVGGTVLVSGVDDESTSLMVVGSFVKAFVSCELIETGSVSAAVLGAAIVVVGSVSGVGACVVVSGICDVVVISVVISVILSLVVSVVVTVLKVLMGVLSAFGAAEGFAVVDVAPLISIVPIVSAFGLVVLVVSSLVGGVVLASSRAGLLSGVIATVIVVASLDPPGLIVVVAELVSLAVPLVPGASVGN